MIIRANLGYRFFFAFCMLSGLFLPVICIIELVRKFNLLVFTDFIALIFGLGMGLWLFLYCFKFVFGCSIILNEKSIILKNWKNKFSNLSVENSWEISDFILPSSINDEVKIENIEQVVLGSLNKLKKICQEIGDEKTEKEIGSFRYKLKKTHLSKVVGFHSSRQYLYIKVKNNDSRIIDVSLFSKNHLKDLFKILREKNKNIILRK